MLLSKCAICGSKKSRFIKKQEPSRILSSLSPKTPLNKISIIWWYFVSNAFPLNDLV